MTLVELMARMREEGLRFGVNERFALITEGRREVGERWMGWIAANKLEIVRFVLREHVGREFNEWVSEFEDHTRYSRAELRSAHRVLRALFQRLTGSDRRQRPQTRNEQA